MGNSFQFPQNRPLGLWRRRTSTLPYRLVYIRGVSTRSVDDLVKAMGMSGLSKSQVSRLCEEVNERVNAFLQRTIEGEWPYVWIDATYVKVRQDHRITSVAVIIAVGVNAEPRTVPLSPPALELLARMRSNDTNAKGQVFPLTANAFRLAWDRMMRRSKIENLRFHDLRHEAISRFFEMGLSVPEVSLISGHKDVRMLFRYTHLKPENVARKLSQISTT